jgi:hypothetical protein
MATIEIPPDALLTDVPPKNVGGNLPAPLAERLDALVELANREGAGTNRTQVLAALVLHAPEDGQVLLEQVVAYRRAPARAAGIVALPDRNVLEFVRHKRGPRPRSSQAG